MRKFVPGFLVLVLIPACGDTLEEEVEIQSTTELHAQYQVSVPPEPSYYSQISESRQQAWMKLLEQCTPIDTHSTLSESCVSALSEYFPEEPVWNNRMYYYAKYSGLEEMYRVASTHDRDKGIYLPYSAADFLDDYPVWHDIFDGNIESRIVAFLEVLDDPTCRELMSRKSVGIQKNLASQCAARELFKYVAYLDACSTAMNRLHTLNRKDPEAISWSYWEDEKKNPSGYDISLQFIKHAIESEDDRKIAKRRMQRGYLLAYWTAKQCEPHSYVLMPGLTVSMPAFPSRTQTSDQSLLKWDQSFELDNLKSWFDSKLLSRTYQHTLTIAAKSGDDWAIRTSNLHLVPGQNFRAELRQEYPILTHRWLGSTYGDTKHQRLHQAKAYLLLTEKAGEAIAQLEYDSGDLATEIEYILDGGWLSYPLTWEKLPKGITQ